MHGHSTRPSGLPGVFCHGQALTRSGARAHHGKGHPERGAPAPHLTAAFLWQPLLPFLQWLCCPPFSYPFSPDAARASTARPCEVTSSWLPGVLRGCQELVLFPH